MIFFYICCIMKKIVVSLTIVFLGLPAVAQVKFNQEIHQKSPAVLQNQIVINPHQNVGPVKKLNGVGAGPNKVVSSEMYEAANIPLARLHDIGGGTEHTVEIMRIFTDFDADENDPANYDFAMTDEYVKKIIDTGTMPMYRLGNSNHEPNSLKKYGAWPPKDYAKWARICEHVVKHYTQGWANGFHYDMKFWEIWNEPDLDQRLLPEKENILPQDKKKVGVVPRYLCYPHAWGGTMEEYYKFYSTALAHLQKTCPDVMFGGPAFSAFQANEPFILKMKEYGVKPDFYTWHRYSNDPRRLAAESILLRNLLDENGWTDMITILDEWNHSGNPVDKGSIKGAAFVAAALIELQELGDCDMTTYYDFRPSSTYNGAFNKDTKTETWVYYSLYHWGKLLEYGTQTKTLVKSVANDVYATTAKDEDGRIRMLIARFNNDSNVYKKITVTLPLPANYRNPLCFLCDSEHLNAEYPFPIEKNKLKIDLEPNAIVYIQF